MPGKTIGVTLGLGYPGSYSRSADCIIQNRPAKGDIPFGAPVVLNADGTFSAFGEANTANQFAGVAVREVKQQTDYYAADVVYKDKEPLDCLVRGSIVVSVTGEAPAAGGSVYIRIAEDASAPDSPVGSFVTAADGANTVEIPNAVFHTGKIDGNGAAEITVLSRKV